MATEELTISGMHCNACEKTITRALGKEGLHVESIDYKTGKAVVSGTAVPKDRINELLGQKGYTLLSESAVKRKVKKSTYAFEKEILTNGFLALSILLVIQVALALFVYRLFPGYKPNYLLPFIYVPIVVVTNMIALWHQRAYAKNVSCMTGMMVGMTIGMTTGFALGAIIGYTNGMFVGSLVTTIIAIAAGVYAGRCCGIMGTMEGMMAGLMGGTMGPMISVMMINDRIEIFLPILIGITIVILAGLMRIVIEEHQDSDVELQPWPFMHVLAVSLLLTLAISIIILVAPKGIFG